MLAGGLLTGKHGGAGAMAPLPNSRFADDEATPMKSAAMCANECMHTGTVPRAVLATLPDSISIVVASDCSGCELVYCRYRDRYWKPSYLSAVDRFTEAWWASALMYFRPRLSDVPHVHDLAQGPPLPNSTRVGSAAAEPPIAPADAAIR